MGMAVLLGASLFSFGWIIKTVIIAAAIFVLTDFLEGVHVNGRFDALLVSVVLSLLNATVEPILTFVASPITAITSGLFHFVIYAVLIWIADYILDGFKLKNFAWALAMAIPLTILSTVLDKIF